MILRLKMKFMKYFFNNNEKPKNKLRVWVWFADLE